MIVVDTGVLLAVAVAVADADDGWHSARTTLHASYRSDQLTLPAPVMPDTRWMIAGRTFDDGLRVHGVDGRRERPRRRVPCARGLRVRRPTIPSGSMIAATTSKTPFTANW